MAEPEDAKLSKELIDPVVEPIADKFHRLGLIATAALAVKDFGLTNSLFQAFIRAPSERRKHQAMHLIIDAIDEIKERILRTEEQLQNNEAFVSTAATAYSMATLTAEPEKLAAIKQALISSANEGAPSEAAQQMHLASLANMTSIHLRLLGYFKNLTFANLRVPDIGNRDVQDSYFEKVKPYLAKDTFRPMIERATRDLLSWGVISVPPGAPQSMSGPNFITMMLTDFGKGLVEFIDA